MLLYIEIDSGLAGLTNIKMTQYCKLIGRNHGKFPYKLGLNSLADNNEVFDPSATCCAGGLYFTSLKHLSSFLSFGDKLCFISVPEDAIVVKIGEKWKADKIIIESVRPLWTIETWNEIHAMDPAYHSREKWAELSVMYGKLDLFEFLFEQKENWGNFNLLYLACDENQYNIVRFLVDKGTGTHSMAQEILELAVVHGDFRIVRKIIDEFRSCCDINNPCVLAAKYGYWPIVEYLLPLGVSNKTWQEIIDSVGDEDSDLLEELRQFYKNDEGID